MKIIWHKKRYIGENAKKRQKEAEKAVENLRPFPGVYVITFSMGGNNVFDIYPLETLLAGWFPKKEISVLGLALGYGEALELAGQMTGDLYHLTGGFDPAAFFGPEDAGSE